jgi:hypothetical protein
VTTFNFFPQNTPQIVIPAIPHQILARSGRNPTSFFFSLFFLMNKFGGRFASGMKWELAVGDSPTRFGSDGGRFTTRAHLCLFVSLSLARSVSLSHSLSLAHSLPLTLFLSLTHSLPLTLTGGLGHIARSFDGGIEGSEPHHTCEPFLLGRVSPLQTSPKRRTPKLDQREKLLKKKKLARIHRIQARFLRNPAGYCWNHC